MLPDILLRHRERFVYIYTITGVVALILFGVLPHTFAGHTAYALFEGTVALLLALNVVAYRWHRNYLILSNFAHFLIMLTFVFLIVTGGYRGTGIYWCYAYPLLSFFLTSKREIIFWNVAFLLSCLGLYLLKPDMFYYDFITLRQALGAYVAVFILAFAYNTVISDLIGVLSERASVDALTGLYSRYFFLESLSKAISQLERGKDVRHTIVYLDLDNFKRVNDTHGHHVGDEVLRHIADLLRNYFRRADIVARFGGDEFMILAHNGAREGIEERLKALRKEIENRFKDYGLSLSYGIVQIPEDGTDADRLIREADKRMYEMKVKNKR
ncbi:diguanylate cyclase (GGDEF)-like protein [Hydrogenivirga caldilitoris]|uniref:diguanylate cyclase n=1 Tax=Hydrogenivirga caldilitoris TaxID=246264 RepID=A0A497XRX0_9AQUI|nr:GGDEF domain-containing protein [Hydrogenivirga caldilitoris]RLJ69882.1 diguanylate cyclase (GGDEF)-like protein [Hydrogenivirga caldilitoris]